MVRDTSVRHVCLPQLRCGLGRGCNLCELPPFSLFFQVDSTQEFRAVLNEVVRIVRSFDDGLDFRVRPEMPLLYPFYGQTVAPRLGGGGECLTVCKCTRQLSPTNHSPHQCINSSVHPSSCYHGSSTITSLLSQLDLPPPAPPPPAAAATAPATIRARQLLHSQQHAPANNLTLNRHKQTRQQIRARSHAHTHKRTHTHALAR